MHFKKHFQIIHFQQRHFWKIHFKKIHFQKILLLKIHFCKIHFGKIHFQSFRVIMLLRVIRIRSLIGILTHQGHIRKVNENVHSVSK